MDYHPYRWTNRGITIYTALISVDLTQYEIFREVFDSFLSRVVEVVVEGSISYSDSRWECI